MATSWLEHTCPNFPLISICSYQIKTISKQNANIQLPIQESWWPHSQILQPTRILYQTEFWTGIFYFIIKNPSNLKILAKLNNHAYLLQVYWKNPKGYPQYTSAQIARKKFRFTTNRPWTMQFLHQNDRNVHRKKVFIEPIGEWSFFK